MAILGIDLGTTNSLVGVVDSGFPILLADGSGSRIVPSVVMIPESGEPVIGAPALRQRLVHPERTVTSVKRLMGKRYHECDPARVGYNFCPDAKGEALLQIAHDRQSTWSPVDVSSLILAHLKSVAERAMEASMDRAIITVPAYFNDAQRQATKRAGEIAGLTVERILNEPTAAALSFGLHKSYQDARVAVYDLGGGTFDVSILEIRDGLFQVLSTNGDTYLGGDDIDSALAEHLWMAFAGESSRPLSEQSVAQRMKFQEEAEKAKCALSTVMEYEVSLPFVEEAKHFQQTITRETLEYLARPIVERTRRLCLQALHDAKLLSSDLDEIVLVGGNSRMPFVRSFVSELFDREVNTTENPEESIATGAVIQGGILSGELRNVVLLDVTPLSLGIESFGGLMNVIIPRNSTIPIKAGEMFTNAVANQSSMLVRVLQGEREMARDNWQLGQIEVPFEPGAKSSARIGVQFKIDENGILEVLTRNTKTEEDTVLEIQNAAVNVEDAEVEKMISESVDHAFEDLTERQFSEAKLKSDELLPAVDQAMAVVGESLGDKDRAAISKAVVEVQQALQAADLSALKQANKHLDDATQELAALMIEKAMADSMGA